MKTLNKEELKAVAIDVFGRYPKAQKVAVTSDGTAFITDESENAVLNHSKRNSSGKELDISRFTRDQLEVKKITKSVKDLVSEIEASTDVTVVESILAAESEGQKRKGVIEAAEKKIKELKPE